MTFASVHTASSVKHSPVLLSSTSENNKMDGAASCPTGVSSSEGIVIVVMVGVTGLTV